MSTMYVNNIAPLEGNTINVASGKTLYAPGHVIQVVGDTSGGQVDITSTSFVDTGVSLAITTTVTNSKIAVLFGIGYNTSLSASRINIKTERVIGSSSSTIDTSSIRHRGSDGDFENRFPITLLDSPNVATGTIITYKIFVAGGDNDLCRLNDNVDTTLTLMEIAG